MEIAAQFRHVQGERYIHKCNVVCGQGNMVNTAFAQLGWTKVASAWLRSRKVQKTSVRKSLF